jgi:hypothetical protein
MGCWDIHGDVGFFVLRQASTFGIHGERRVAGGWWLHAAFLAASQSASCSSNAPVGAVASAASWPGRKIGSVCKLSCGRSNIVVSARRPQSCCSSFHGGRSTMVYLNKRYGGLLVPFSVLYSDKIASLIQLVAII